MKKLIILLTFLTAWLTSYSQAPLIPSVRCSLTVVTVFSDPYTVSGKTSDFSSNWEAADIVAGDSLYLMDGNELRIYSVVSVSSASGADFTISIDDINNSGNIPITGEWGILSTGTTNYDFPNWVAGVSETLNMAVQNRFVQRLDGIINGLGGSSTNNFESHQLCNTGTSCVADSTVIQVCDSVDTVYMRVPEKAGDIVWINNNTTGYVFVLPEDGSTIESGLVDTVLANTTKGYYASDSALAVWNWKILTNTASSNLNTVTSGSFYGHKILINQSAASTVTIDATIINAVGSTLLGNEIAAFADCSLSAITFTLPTPSAFQGKGYEVVKKDTGSNPLILSGTFDVGTQKLIYHNQPVTVISNGTAWYVKN